MPKIHWTREEKALALLERLRRGPSWSASLGFCPEKAEEQYRRWAESWILKDLVDLVPELKKAKTFHLP